LPGGKESTPGKEEKKKTAKGAVQGSTGGGEATKSGLVGGKTKGRDNESNERKKEGPGDPKRGWGGGGGGGGVVGGLGGGGWGGVGLFGEAGGEGGGVLGVLCLELSSLGVLRVLGFCKKRRDVGKKKKLRDRKYEKNRKSEAFWCSERRNCGCWGLGYLSCLIVKVVGHLGGGGLSDLVICVFWYFWVVGVGEGWVGVVVWGSRKNELGRKKRERDQ